MLIMVVIAEKYICTTPLKRVSFTVKDVVKTFSKTINKAQNPKAK